MTASVLPAPGRHGGWRRPDPRGPPPPWSLVLLAWFVVGFVLIRAILGRQ